MLVAGRFDYWLLLLITAQILNDLFLQFDQFTSQNVHLGTQCRDKASVHTLHGGINIVFMGIEVLLTKAQETLAKD